MSNDSNFVTNLIDLSADDDPCSPLQTTQPPSSSNCSTYTPPLPLIPLTNLDGRESLDNNPFDCIQKQANRPDDPFELISREASYQPHYSQSLGAACQTEVRIGNLLCMSDDSIKAEEETSPPVVDQFAEFSALQVPSSRFHEPICSVSSIGSTVYSSPCDDSAFKSRNESSKSINKAFITDHSISSFSEDNRAHSAMNKGFVESCSSFDHSPAKSTPENAAQPPSENSDSSGKGRSQKPADARKRLLKLSLSNSTSNSPLCRRPFDDDNSSPLSSVFSEAENLADHFASRCGFDSGKSFDDSCDDLMSIKPNWIDSETDIDSDLEMMKIPILQEIKSPIVNKKATTSWEKIEEIPEPILKKPISANNSPDLEALKEKVQQHKAEKNNNNEIKSLIENLKLVIKDCANDAKKSEANNLLECLSNLMNDKNGSGTIEKTDTLTPPPQPIVRQGTFDMELKENECADGEGKEEEPQHQSEEDAHTDQNISTGTHSVHSVQSPEADQAQVSDIVEQIGRLLGNQNVNVVQASLSTNTSNGAINPTYIVVMNTPLPTKQRPSIDAMDYQNDGSPDLAHSQGRRRSQSLSIHDKEKSANLLVPPSPLRNDCKTPMRAPMIRRNSFSSSNSCTPIVQNNRRSVYGAGFGGCGGGGGSNNLEAASSKQSHLQRRSMALETHHEKQQNAPQQQQPPIGGASGISFNAKKLKFKQSTESIFKANGPMKATIPVKKVAPMIVMTNADSPTEETATRFKSVTSTPNVQNNPSKYYPNACSTPMIEASPIKRSGLTKSRYSFVAATPTPKHSSLAPSTSQARRRTMNEMRSPKKVGDKPSTSGIMKPGTVKTVKLPQNFSKTLNKMAPASSKGVLRLTKPSPPSAGGAVDKNKENKLPRSTR
ncbi:uncharacterized protein LOC129944783 [Eupeodes corollae]|uniref:uncharacterized protein LOC129944783 n=1 Tax=Eupeodes corollae TaxID=290404 RepID=UPI002490C2BB|nr:uncharacterized protein LOC129944783 [Eupeodes corollae]